MVTFEYPGYNPTYSIELRNPILRDSDTVDLDVMVHASQDNTIYTVVHTDQQKARSTVLSFEGICQSELSTIESFFKGAVGHYLRYTDYRNHEYLCKVQDQEVTVEAPGEDNHTFTLVIHKWDQNITGLPKLQEWQGDLFWVRGSLG